MVDSGQTQLANAMMGSAFGERRGAALLPLFAQGSEHLNELAGEAATHGQAMTPAQAAAAAKFEESYKQMGSAVQGLGYAIGNELFPTLTPIIADMTAMGGRQPGLDRHQYRRCGQGTGGLAARRSIGKKSAPISEKWPATRLAGRSDRRHRAGIGDHRRYQLYPVMREFYSTWRGGGRHRGRVGVVSGAGLIDSIATLIPTIGSLSDAWAALDLVMDANPIGVIVLGLAALAAGAYEVYEHWDQLETLMSKCLPR